MLFISTFALLIISFFLNYYLIRNNLKYTFSVDIYFAKEVITIISLSIASYVGLQGLNTWKKSLSGTEKHQKAKDLLLDLYTYKDLFYNYRNPFIFSNEYPNNAESEYPSAFKSKDYEDSLFVYQNRLNKVREYTKKLYLHKLEGKILFGLELEEKITQIFQLENRVSNEIENFLENKKENGDCPYDSRVIFGKLSSDDPIRSEMEMIVHEVERVVSPHLI